MNKIKNTHDNFLANFVLKGFTSILIGVYILLGSYLIKLILNGFLVDGNPMGFMSPQIIEILISTIAFLVFLFSSFALFFSGRRIARKFRFKLWNGKTKTTFIEYILFVILMFVTLFLLIKEGFIDFLTPAFLLLYGVLLIILRKTKNINLLILALISFLLAILCYVIPSYWYSALSILGIGHIVYGLAVRN